MRATLIVLGAALALAGCATPRSVEVTRFHLGQPIATGAIAVVPADGAASFSLEYRSYADAVARELAAIGFLPVGNNSQASYVATLTVDSEIHEAGPRRSPVSIGFGFGGGSFGRHGGVGVSTGASFPVGRPRANEVRVNTLGLQIKRRSDGTVIWEGHATAAVGNEATDASLAAQVPSLAHALLAGFPGPAGQTVRVPVK